MLTCHTERLHLHLYFIRYNLLSPAGKLRCWILFHTSSWSMALSTAAKIWGLPHYDKLLVPWPPFPKGPAACCIGSLLLLVPTYATREIYRPQAVSQKFQILNATFSRSSPRDTAKYCIKPGVKTRPQELLRLENIAFFQKKICCKFTFQSESWSLLPCFLFCTGGRWAHGPGCCKILGATHCRFFKKKWRIFEAQRFRRHRKHKGFLAILWGLARSRNQKSGT